MQIQNGDKGHLATLPLVKAESLASDVLVKMKQFRRDRAVVARRDGTYTVVTAKEVSAALRARKEKKTRGARIGELYLDRESIPYADVGVMGRVMQGLWEVRGGHLDYRIVAVGQNAVTVIGPTADHWLRLRGKKGGGRLRKSTGK